MTSKTIVIKWTNPEQYQTGLTGPSTMPLVATSPIVTDPTNSTGGQIWFPIVNRIMIQIKNLDHVADSNETSNPDEYQTWGTRKSQNQAALAVANGNQGATYFGTNARVICEKAKVIPPAPGTSNNITPGITYTDAGTTVRTKVHTLSEFANSIILYKDTNVPTYLEEDSGGTPTALVPKRVYNPPSTDADENLTFSIPDSIKGYEIKIWLENQYYTGTASSPSLTEDDLNVVTFNTVTRKMDKEGVEDNTYVPNPAKPDPITFQKVSPPTELYVADYSTNDGFHVEVGRVAGTTIHYLECIIPPHTQISDGTDYIVNSSVPTPLTSQTSGVENDVYFKGYFIEYQTIPADGTYSSNTVTDISDAFVSNTSGFQDWVYRKFHTIENVFIYNESESTKVSLDLAKDIEAKINSTDVDNGDIDWTDTTLTTVINPQTEANYGDGFIAAGRVTAGAFDTKTSGITYSVSKAFLLPQGDNKFYRFRIRGLNTGNIKPGPPSTKYAYFIFNKPAPICWNIPAPIFIPTLNTWSIRLTWKDISSNNIVPYYSSIGVTVPTTLGDPRAYQPDKIAIMEYKLERRDTTGDTDNAEWRTISYWANNRKTISTLDPKGLDTTHDYQIWPTPFRTKDENYADYTVTDDVVRKITNGWELTNENEYAEWNTASSDNSVFTVEARLMAAGRTPTFQFRIQARNYLYGKRIKSTSNPDASNPDVSNPEFVDKYWLQENAITDTITNAITDDTRWSDHSPESATLVTTAHTTAHTSAYTPSLHDNNGIATSYSANKYQIKFYEQGSADDHSPWNGTNTDYSDNGRPVNYTIANTDTFVSPKRNSTNNIRFSSDYYTNNSLPTADYIAYQWKLSEMVNDKLSTTQDASGLSIDRYEIIETINMGTTSEAITAAATAAIPTIIYSPDFRRGPANWHINEYTPIISASPSFKFTVRAFNFFNSTSSNYSTTSTELTPIKPSVPLYLSNVAVTGIDGKVSSNPTFTLKDTGITILVDEPKYTGYNTNSTATQYNDKQYQDQAISISEFALLEGKFNISTPMSTGEIDLINGTDNTLTIRSGSSIQGNQSQVATFFHPNGYTITITTNAVVASNKLTFATDHGLSTGTPIKYIGGGTTSITELAVSDTYYVIAIAGENKKMKLATTVTNATNSTFIAITGGDAGNTFAYGKMYLNDLKDLTTGQIEYTFHAKNVLKNVFSETSSCTLTIGKPYPTNFKYCPKFTWVASENQIKLDFFRKYNGTDILFDDPDTNAINGSTVAPLSNVTGNFSNTIKKLKWQVQGVAPGGAAINNSTLTATYSDCGDDNYKDFTIFGDASDTKEAYTISDTGIENWTLGDKEYTINYKVRNQYNEKYFASNVSSDIGSDVEPLKIKLNVPTWTSNPAAAAPNNVFTSKFTYGLPTATSEVAGNKIVISWNRPYYGGLYFKHEGGGSISPVTSPNIQKYKIYFKATDRTISPHTYDYYICTITKNWGDGETYDNAINSLTIYSGGTTLPAHSTANDEQTIAIKKITGTNAAYTGTETNVTSTDFKFKPEHEYTVEKITAINWLYDAESDNMNADIKTRYQNGINGGTTETITDLIPVRLDFVQTVNYPPIGSNKYIATEENSAAATAASTTDPGIAHAVAGPQLQTFSQYPNNGALISEGTSSTTIVGSVNKLETKAGTTVYNIIINKDYAKIPTTVSTTNTVGMSIRLGVKIGTSGTETFTNFCTFTKSACSGKKLEYTWGPTNTEIATISSGTTNADNVVPADIYAGNDDWKTDNQSYWFASDSIKISTHQNINNVTDFWGESVVFKVYVYYHSVAKVYNPTAATAADAAAAATDTASWTLSNTTTAGAAAGDYYDDGGLTVPTAIATEAGTITYTGDQVYTVLGLPILKTGKMPSITYNFDNKSTKWALHTDKKVLDVKLAPEEPIATNTANVLSTTDTDNTKHTWSTTTNVPLATGLAITYPNPSSFPSLVHDAKLFVKATNIVGTQTAWYTNWSGNTKYIYDPKTVDLIETIGRQNLDTSQLTISTSTTAAVFKSNADETFTTLPLYNVLKIPDNFDPISATAKYVNSSTAAREDIFGTLGITGAGIAAAVSGVVPPSALSQVLIYDGKFVSENYFRTNFGTSGANYHGNVTAYINNVGGDLPATGRSTHCTTSGGDANDTLEKNYRWGLFSMKFTNKKAAAASVFGGEFLLGSDSYCNFTPGDLIPTENFGVANVEIWYKVININRPNEGVKLETRWNKLCNNNGATVNGIGIADMVGTNTYLNNASSGWILNSEAGTATAAFADAESAAESASSNIEWKDNKRIQFVINQVSSNSILSQASGADRGGELIILIAIGIKNNVSRFYSIPRMSGTLRLYKGTGTGTLYHGLSSTTYLD